MNVIKGKKLVRQQRNRIIDAEVTIIKDRKITIDHAIYIKLLSDGSVYFIFITVSNYDVFNTINNETAFTELTRVFEEPFENKVQEGYVLKYPTLRLFQYPLGFSFDHTDNIIELLNE